MLVYHVLVRFGANQKKRKMVVLTKVACSCHSADDFDLWVLNDAAADH